MTHCFVGTAKSFPAEEEVSLELDGRQCVVAEVAFGMLGRVYRWERPAMTQRIESMSHLTHRTAKVREFYQITQRGNVRVTPIALFYLINLHHPFPEFSREPTWTHRLVRALPPLPPSSSHTILGIGTPSSFHG